MFVLFVMWFAYSEFRGTLRMLGMGRKRLKNWMWLYTWSMLGLLGVIAFRKRDYLRTFIEPAE